MKKLNKKGFTLIEMLVVIAIIAILVAIIIPTVTSATTKAKASTDAANLRSAKAAATMPSEETCMPASRQKIMVRATVSFAPLEIPRT